MPAPPGIQTGTRRCAICGTRIPQGVVCDQHRTSRPDVLGEATRKTIEELSLDALAVPRTYQRQLREHLVRRIIREFDPDLLGLLVVVRDGEGRLWILDGQHRWLALVELGYTSALCEVVLHDVPLPRQAEIFSGRNSRRVTPRPSDAFRADYVANDPDAVAVMNVLDRHGFEPPFGSGRASARRFVCVSALREVHGWRLLAPTVALIHQAWPDDDLATQAPILLGLAAVLRLFPEVSQRELGKRLARHSADEVLRLARAQHANSRERRLWVHVAAVVVDLHNHGRTAAHRLPAVHVPYDAARQWKAGRR